MFELLARGEDGQVFREYIERLIRHVESIRTQMDISFEARKEVADLLEENFINRIKVLRGEIDAPNHNEYE